MNHKTNHKLKDPGSAITHLIAMISAAVFAIPLIHKATFQSEDATIAMTIFICSMILLYGASTLYHSLDISIKVNKFLKRLDHSMIFVLIAGSYTPICMLVLPSKYGIPMLIYIWTMAFIGILVKIAFVFCPHWVSSSIYIFMGWTCVFAFRIIIENLSHGAFLWLLVGGIIYTIGGILYAFDLPIFHKLPKNFGRHEIFHLFVMGGSLCHFIVMYLYLL
ncbi:MAG: hemolysin III family protein [Eubacteriales bacterium]|nr:hemolysin III family protein [Eubacteriales bacterium]